VERLRVATLNTLYYPQGDRWKARLPVAGRALRDHAADVVCLQEVDRAKDRDRALAGFATDRDYRVIRASDVQRDRYPRHWDGVVTLVAAAAGQIEGHAVQRLTHHRVVQAVDVRIGVGRVVRIANTHLHHPDDAAGVRTRVSQVEAILGWLDELAVEQGPATAEILAGDFNAGPDEPAIDRLRARGFSSAYEVANGRAAATFPSGLVASTIAPGPPTVCIDYVWLRGRASVRSARLAFDTPSPTDSTLYPSDHLGIVADIDLDAR